MNDDLSTSKVWSYICLAAHHFLIGFISYQRIPVNALHLDFIQVENFRSGCTVCTLSLAVRLHQYMTSWAELFFLVVIFTFLTCVDMRVLCCVVCNWAGALPSAHSHSPLVLLMVEFYMKSTAHTRRYLLAKELHFTWLWNKLPTQHFHCVNIKMLNPSGFLCTANVCLFK